MRDPLRSVAQFFKPRPGDQRWTFVGTVLIAFSLLSFEVSTVRTINFVVGPSFIYFAIALAMLGLSAAGSILSLVDLKRWAPRRAQILFWCSLGIVALLLACHLVTAEAKQHLNAALEQAGRAGGTELIVRTLSLQSLSSALQIGVLLSLPYFLFGALLAFLFATTPAGVYGRLYAADLIGAAAGCLGAVVAMEATGYAASVTVPVIVAGLAGAAYAAAANRRLALAGLAVSAALCLLPLSDRYSAAIEPTADPNYLIRDYSYEKQVTELWRGWNSYTRVGAVAVPGEHGGQGHVIMSLSNGDGMAWLFPYRPDRDAPVRHWPALPALLRGAPQDSLVLFAGVGADLMTLHENALARTSTTGIELNRTMVDGALALEEFGAAEFLARDGVNLEVTEGRVFLERDQDRYDVVLYSFSGATAAYYAGALGGTTQFLYTYEGLAAAFDRLKSDGYAVVLQISKVNAIVALRRYLAERGLGDPLRTAIILYTPGDSVSAWDGPLDDNPMLVKPSGWTDAEIARVIDAARRDGWEVAYAPGRPTHPDFDVYRQALAAADIDGMMADLRRETGLRFSLVTDDRPFYLDLFSTGLYWDPEFWSRFADGTARPHEVSQMMRAVFVVIVSVVACAFILFPLLFRKGPRANGRTASHLVYFFCLGAGFMTLEIVLMQKSSLLFGNPGLTIALVLACVILFSGIGSLVSGWTFDRGLRFRTAAIGIVLYVVALYAGLDPALKAMLDWPLVAKGLGLAAIIAPGALLLGHMFPQGLAFAAREDPALIPWAWGINGATGTMAAGLTPLLAQAWGFNTVFLIGAGLYALILLLPAYSWSRWTRPAEASDALAAAE